MHLLPVRCLSAAENMAADSRLLELASSSGSIFFRAYGWSEPAVTCGYRQQRASLPTHLTETTTVIRRSTGGGLVDHRNDWTYALALPAEHPMQRAPALDTYRCVHTCLRDTLRKLGVDCELLDDCSARGGELCFTKASAYDLISTDGQKLAGAAMRRTRQGLLVQGSLDRACLPAQASDEPLIEAFTQLLSQSLNTETPEVGEWLVNGWRAEVERFQSDEWNFRL